MEHQADKFIIIAPVSGDIRVILLQGGFIRYPPEVHEAQYLNSPTLQQDNSDIYMFMYPQLRVNISKNEIGLNCTFTPPPSKGVLFNC